MDSINLIGTIAAICTTISFLPQVFRIYRTKHTADLSLPMYILFVIGVFLWLCYGILTKSLPIILANSVTFFLCLSILIMKLIYK